MEENDIIEVCEVSESPKICLCDCDMGCKEQNELCSLSENGCGYVDNGERTAYKADLPYPKVKNICKNPKYAVIVKNLYSGPVSELTAILQYLYGSWHLRDEHKECYEALKSIAIVEMEHMDLLAQVLLCLGGDVKYTYRTPSGECAWNGRLVVYSKAPLKIIIDSIASEKRAIADYERACTIIKDENVTAVIERIILDEQMHLCIFEELYRKLLR